jgi:hypothetical protein
MSIDAELQSGSIEHAEIFDGFQLNQRVRAELNHITFPSLPVFPCGTCKEADAIAMCIIRLEHPHPHLFEDCLKFYQGGITWMLLFNAKRPSSFPLRSSPGYPMALAFVLRRISLGVFIGLRHCRMVRDLLRLL